MSDDIWYAETKTFAGKWTPNLFHGDKPEEKTVNGKRELNNVNKLTPDLLELSLGELFEHFNGICESRAEFRSVRGKPAA